MQVSFVISTHNRRDVLLDTLRRVNECGLDSDQFEILVVDNASNDNTAQEVASQFPSVRLFALPVNRGACAKNIAIRESRGKYTVLLDDDSFPQPGSIQRMIEHFESDGTLGAAVFTIHLMNGSNECSAYPDVFIGCGSGFRTTAIEQVGPLPDDFFMQAEEYDLSLRLLDAGWRIRTFDDLHVTHLKTATARRSWRTMRLDVRNNLVVALRYFPRQWKWSFARSWMSRYWQIAASKGQRSAFFVGLAQGLLGVGKRRPISDKAFEQFTRMSQIKSQMRKLHASRVLFVDYGKNMHSYWQAARELGITVVGIADNNLSGSFRGIRIHGDHEAQQLSFDAAVISNSSPVHARMRARRWREMDMRRLIDPLSMPRESGDAVALAA